MIAVATKTQWKTEKSGSQQRSARLVFASFSAIFTSHSVPRFSPISYTKTQSNTLSFRDIPSSDSATMLYSYTRTASSAVQGSTGGTALTASSSSQTQSNITHKSAASQGASSCVLIVAVLLSLLSLAISAAQ
jgi:hypothetical protein